MKVIITGKNGLLGYRACQYFQDKYDVTGLAHQDMDITDSDAVMKKISQLNPDIVIHCAGIPHLDVCEKEPELADKVNVGGAKNVAGACKSVGARMIFCSTDQVYEGSQIMEPHKEEEVLSPTPYYGQGKLKAEEYVMEADANNICLRLGWMFDTKEPDRKPEEGGEHQNLFHLIRQSLKEHKNRKFPDNDFRSLTNIWSVIQNMEKLFDPLVPGGIYNFGSDNTLSTYEVIYHFLKQTNQDVSCLERGKRICRNADKRILVMNTEKAKKQGIIFESSLEGFLKKIE